MVTRKSIPREKERIEAATEENLKGFAEKLESIIAQYKLKPHQIHNVDESYIDLGY